MATEPLQETREAADEVDRLAEPESETALLEALRRRDEPACRALIQVHHAGMVQVARSFVATRALAEELAQETWIAFFEGLERFESRSTLKTWLFAILIRKAKKLWERETRSEAFSQLSSLGEGSREDGLEQLFRRNSQSDQMSWGVPLNEWSSSPETNAIRREELDAVGKAIAMLPRAQRLVVVLRDGYGWTAQEVADLLDRTPNWVRVNLHRGRLRVRAVVVEQRGETGVRNL